MSFIIPKQIIDEIRESTIFRLFMQVSDIRTGFRLRRVSNRAALLTFTVASFLSVSIDPVQRLSFGFTKARRT
jgi:hypothetical protein